MISLRKLLIALPIAGSLLASCTTRARAQLTVFDPANYQENLLSSARALEQINNQIRQLQNQVLVIQRMDQNLVRLGSTLSPDLQRTLTDLQSQLRSGNAIALRLQTTQSDFQRLFPQQVSAAITSDDVLRNAKSRWDEEYAAFQRAAFLQGQVADNIDGDKILLANAMARSRDAAGILEATQAGNELQALGIKQSLTLQGLLTAQYRADTTTRARNLATEAEARQRFQSFVGTGSAYTAGR